MKLEFLVPNHAPILRDEIEAAIPSLRGSVKFTSFSGGITLDVPDGSDIEAIEAVVSNHTPNPTPKVVDPTPDPARGLLAKPEKDWTDAEMRSALKLLLERA